MRDTLRRPDYFYALDYDGIARHLERMAAKGWLLEKTGPFLWTYRRIEPRRLKFRVTYYPVASGFDPEPTPGEAELGQLCGHTGWRLLVSGGLMQIFCTDDPEPAPIGTDPALELSVVHRKAMGSVLPMAAMLLLMSLYLIAALKEQIMGGAAVWGLSGLSLGFVTGLLGLVAVYYALELGAYAVWYVRAKRAAEKGEWAPSAGISHVICALQWMAFVGMLAWGGAAAVFAQGAERFIGLFPLIMALAAFSGTDRLRQRLRARKTPRRRAQWLTALAGAAAFSMVFIMFKVMI